MGLEAVNGWPGDCGQFVFRVFRVAEPFNQPLIGCKLVITEITKTLHYSECPSLELKGKLQYVYLDKINLETVIYSNQSLTCTTSSWCKKQKHDIHSQASFKVCNNRFIL